MLASVCLVVFGVMAYPVIRNIELPKLNLTASIEQSMASPIEVRSLKAPPPLVRGINWPRCTLGYELLPRHHNYIPRLECDAKIVSRSFAYPTHSEDPCDVFMDD